MDNKNKFQRFCMLLAAAPLLFSTIASTSFDLKENSSVYIEPSAAADTPDEIIPSGVTKDEVDSSKTAAEKTANGDSLRIDNLERPFTKTEMKYHPETDIAAITVAEGSEYYYFTFELAGSNEAKDYPSATYGIEFDTDLDLRGDILLWVKGGEGSQWGNADVKIYEDKNGDVGGGTAVIPDAFAGDGYETLAYPEANQETTDFAWKRMPADGANVIQMAIRKTLFNKSYFFWKAWADGGIANPALFDYNDTFSNTQAGSPDQSNSVYPVKELELVDSTCWVAFGFQPTKDQTGCCYKAPVKAKPHKKFVPPPI